MSHISPPKISTFILSLLVFNMVGLVVADDSATALKDRRTVTVQGEGKVQAVPDIASLTVEVSQEGPDLDAVTAQVRREMMKVLSAIKDQGIDDKDVQTQIFNVRPKWIYDKRTNPQRDGYTVTNRVAVKVRDLKKVGKVLSSVLGSGATTVNGPDFDVDNHQIFERKALAFAYEDAHAKALALAEAAGVHLGDILSMSPGTIGWPGPPRPLMMRAMAMPAAVQSEEPVSAGEQTLSATVTVVYALQ
jgi:uncharacterized protein YggE